MVNKVFPQVRDAVRLTPKRLEILRELLPGRTSIGYLRNPANPFDTDMTDLMAAARSLGLQISVFAASTDRELLSAFQSMAQQQLAGLVVSIDASLATRANLIGALAAHHAIPTISSGRSYVLAGGLISYSPRRLEIDELAGIYAGRILKGDKPADLPVVLPTKFELALNLKTAKELGLTIPPTLFALATEVIE